MGLAALAAAQITQRDLVLEPSAGTGLLAILAEIAGGNLVLNELADTRAELLRLLFPGRPVTRFDAAQIDDHLDAGLRPSVILMNPPFSAVANVDGRTTEATARHLRSALARAPVPVRGGEGGGQGALPPISAATRAAIITMMNCRVCELCLGISSCFAKTSQGEIPACVAQPQC